MLKRAVLEEVAEAWNRDGVEYAVAHGIDGYPVTMGRDLDVMIGARDAERALLAARAVLDGRGLLVAKPPRVWGPRLIAAIPQDKPELIEIHLVPAIAWRNVRLVDRPRPSVRVGPFAVDPWVSFVKRILMPVLAGDRRKVERAPTQFYADAAELAAATERLPELIGREMAARLVDVIAARDLVALLGAAPAVNRRLVRTAAVRHPLRSTRLLARAVARKVALPFNVCSPIVALAGADQGARARMLTSLVEGDRLILLDCVVRRWAVAGAGHATLSATGRPALGAASYRHWALLVRYYFRLLRLGLIDDRIDSSYQRLVLYDGCALDLAAEPSRYGLGPSLGTRLCWRLLPKPDLILLPQSNAAGEHGSNAENVGWTALGRRRDGSIDHPQARVVDLDRSPEEAGRRALRLVVDAFLRKNRDNGAPLLSRGVAA